MRVVCSYCGRELEAKEPLELVSVSHSVCSECSERLSRRRTEWETGEKLDAFDIPVIAVDSNCLLLSANQAAAKWMRRNRNDLFGMNLGALLFCSRGESTGPGADDACRKCGMRRLFDSTDETSEPFVRVPVAVPRDEGPLELVISGHRIEGGMVLMIEEQSETISQAV
jgi:DNA-directed RNA polymerase subunit RPC12/RpoP